MMPADFFDPRRQCRLALLVLNIGVTQSANNSAENEEDICHRITELRKAAPQLV